MIALRRKSKKLESSRLHYLPGFDKTSRVASPAPCLTAVVESMPVSSPPLLPLSAAPVSWAICPSMDYLPSRSHVSKPDCLNEWEAERRQILIKSVLQDFFTIRCGSHYDQTDLLTASC